MLEQNDALDGDFAMMALSFGYRKLFEMAAARALHISRADVADIIIRGHEYGRRRLFRELNIDKRLYDNFIGNINSIYIFHP